MPLSPDEQRILDEIEQRLAEEDPRLVEAVSRTSLYTHLARRIKWSLLGVPGRVPDADGVPDGRPDLLWVAATGFGVMLAAALLIYRYLKQLDPAIRCARCSSSRGASRSTGLLARLAGRFRTPPATPPGS